MSGRKPTYGTSGNGSDYQFVVIGKTGNGKSATCNTILGRKQFAIGRGVSTTTLQVQVEEGTRMGCRLKVVDTPDLSNMSVATWKMEQEVSQWKKLARPGPSAVLLTVRCDIRYTPEEFEIYRQIKQLWGSDLKKRLVVAFTFGDCQDRDIRVEMRNAGQELKKVLEDAKNRYIVFDNKATDNDQQVSELIRIARDISKNSCCCSRFPCCK
ncbi:hypothetical protein BaRGS_00030733 [Batillaria attramentaria]|uniref:AIG1-type G domain-containing protein n=1 Tax=Batillaria attramentaria TaxID=370345 RepID=A0ABD0JSS9_9CAEN